MIQLIQRADIIVFHLFNGWCGWWALDRIVHYEEESQFFRGGILLAAYWWFWFAGSEAQRRSNRQRIIAALIGVLAALMMARALAAALPFRLRPMYVAGLGYHPPSLSILTNMEDWSSFPSDTATVFFALAFGIFCLSRLAGLLLMAYSAVWVCLPRLYLGVHYASDLVAGALLGVIAVGLCVAVLGRENRGFGQRIAARLADAEQRRPQAFYAAAFALSFEIAVMFDDIRNMARGIAHGLHARSHSAGEETALLLIGAVVLAVVACAWVGVLLWRRRLGNSRRLRAQLEEAAVRTSRMG
jgi:undecaprenyl-diphosphatase